MQATVDDYFAGEFLKAADVLQPTKLTIKMVSDADFEEEAKPVLHFNEIEKTLVLNKTNAEAVAEIAGSRNFQDWAGVVVVLFKEKVPFKGKRVDAIRVKAAV
jgi:hypothetical protein